MKKYLLLFILFVFGCINDNTQQESFNYENLSMQDILKNISWYGQNCIKLQLNNTVIYFDPYKLNQQQSEKADIVFITHSHGDHLSESAIKLISDSATSFVLPDDSDCIRIAEGISEDITVLLPGETATVNGINIQAVRAYNIVKSTKHNISKNWLGYVITINRTSVYITGDTEKIPEMENITCNIILLPLGQTYTMNSVEEASEAALMVNAETAIPVHFGEYEGTMQDALHFQELLLGKIETIILERQ